jgi:hypothetical protein
MIGAMLLAGRGEGPEFTKAQLEKYDFDLYRGIFMEIFMEKRPKFARF